MPILFGNVLQSLDGSVNSIWVRQYLGEAALAATGNSNTVMLPLFASIVGFSMAATVLVGQCMGANNITEAKRVVGTSATFFLVLSLSLSLLGFAFTDQPLAWLHTPAMSIAAAVSSMAAQNVGAERWDRVGSVVWAGVATIRAAPAAGA